MNEHNKIINAVAKNVLALHGLFRQGASRVWLQDNGYYITQVEFQPSSWSKGSYLNVGISFLWESTEDLNSVLAFNFGYRVDGISFVDYTGDDVRFEKEIQNLAQKALGKVIEYEKFRDLEYAKKALVKGEKNPLWQDYDLIMLCFLKGDFTEGLKLFNNFLDNFKKRFWEGEHYVEWCETFYNHCTEVLLPQCNSKENAKKMVCDMIQRRRDFFNTKPSFKKLQKEPVWF